MFTQVWRVDPCATSFACIHFLPCIHGVLEAGTPQTAKHTPLCRRCSPHVLSPITPWPYSPIPTSHPPHSRPSPRPPYLRHRVSLVHDEQLVGRAGVAGCGGAHGSSGKCLDLEGTRGEGGRMRGRAGRGSMGILWPEVCSACGAVSTPGTRGAFRLVPHTGTPQAPLSFTTPPPCPVQHRCPSRPRR